MNIYEASVRRRLIGVFRNFNLKVGKEMSISYETLMTKMEQELKKAKVASSQQQMKTHINTVKALSELILETETSSVTTPAPQITSQIVQPPQPQQMMGMQSIQAEKPVEMEDGANGDSLFDF